MSLLFDLWLLSGLSAGYLGDVLADTDLNGDDFGLYSLLKTFGPATPTQVHRWTGWPTTTISAHLRRVEQRGHVNRSPNPQDRRSSLVALSDAGLQALEHATELFLLAMHQLRRRFVPDTLRERLVLQDLDRILRDAAGHDPRPYTVEHAKVSSTAHELSYDGARLTPQQVDDVRRYIAFLRPTAATNGQEPPS